MRYGAHGRCLAWLAGIIAIQTPAGAAPYESVNQESADYSVSALAIAADGSYAVAADAANGAVHLLERGAEFGDLTLLSSSPDGFDSDQASSLSRDIVLHPNGFAYVTSYDDHAVHAYVVGESISLVDAEVHGEGGIDSLAGATRACLSPDGMYLHVAASLSGAVSTFAIDQITGELTFKSSVRNGDRGALGLSSVSDIVMSPDGRYAYTASRAESAIAKLQFHVDLERLVYTEVYFASQENLGMEGVRKLAMSPDGSTLVVSGGDFSGVGVYLRDAETGRLTFSHVDYPSGGDNEIGSGPVAFTEDGLWMVATDRFGNKMRLSRQVDDGAYAAIDEMAFGGGDSGVKGVVLSSDRAKVYAAMGDGSVSRLSRVHGNHIVGAFVDAATDFAVADVSVIAIGPETVATCAGAGGMYAFDSLELGEYTLRASAPGYEAVEWTVDVASYDPIDVGVVALGKAEMAFEGSVVDELGVGVPGAIVSIVDESDDVLLVMATRADGWFGTSDELPEGAVGLNVEASGYAVVETVVAIDSPIELSPSATGSCVIEGSALGMRAGELKSDISARVCITGPLNVSLTPDVDGGFVSPVLPEGLYVVHVSGPRHYAQQRVVTVNDGGAALVNFELDLAPYPTDVDGDGTVNSSDVQLVINGLLSGSEEYPTDINGDKTTNALDVQGIIVEVLGN